jgi:glycosyltransferase involved in cell wall biosynthesis
MSPRAGRPASCPLDAADDVCVACPHACPPCPGVADRARCPGVAAEAKALRRAAKAGGSLDDLIRRARGAPPPIVLHTYVCSWQGYGRIARSLGQALEALGRGVGYQAVPVAHDVDFFPPDGWVRARILPPPRALAAPWALQLQVPETIPPPGRRTAAFTMWEATGLGAVQVAMLSRAEVVIVPCAWNAESFAAAGVAAPIRVVPLGLTDPECCRPKPAPPAGPTRFGACGRQVHGRDRKNLAAAVRAFALAFPRGDEAATLEVRAFDRVALEAPADPRVRVLREGLTSAGLGDWYRSLDAFALPSRGEGHGMHGHEAAACGTPVLAALYGGTLAYTAPGDCYPVAFAEVPAGDNYSGRWCEPDVADLARQMRRVHEDRAGAFAVGRRASARAHALTWERSARALLGVLREFGFPG